MSDSTRTKAQQLLDAQVQFWLQDLNADRLLPLLQEEVPFLYEKLGQLSLRESVSEEKVKATALRYAVEMEIEGGIPELIGEIANIIYEHPNNAITALEDVLSDDIATDFLKKVFEPNSLLDQAITNIRSSEPFSTFLSDVIFTAVKSYALEQNQLLKITPVANSVQRLRDWLNDKAPALTENANSLGRQLADNGVNNSLQLVDELLDNELYRDSAFNSTLNLWDEIKPWKISTFQQYFSELDLQELMVLGYEFWLEFRHTDYLKSCIDTGVKFFFDKYGDDTIHTLLSDLGVTEEMIVSEIVNYAPDLGQLLLNHNIAEAIIRRHLQRFYFDEATLAILSEE
jgi:hypothetical protein